LFSGPLQFIQPAQEKPDDEPDPHLTDDESPKKPAQLTSLRTLVLPHLGQLIFFPSPEKTSCSKHCPQQAHSYSYIGIFPPELFSNYKSKFNATI
jgi:hypothetical protein